jgi:hypothetical protein
LPPVPIVTKTGAETGTIATATPPAPPALPVGVDPPPPPPITVTLTCVADAGFVQVPGAVNNSVCS